MSSDPPSDARSAASAEPGLAAEVRLRGQPLIEALEKHLPGAREHANGTGSYAFIAAAGLGFDRAHAELVREAARLHDVGKVYVPAEVLGRPEAELSPDQAAQVANRFEAGATLARGAGIPETVCVWLLRLREHFDGTGPTGIGGEAIPVESRIIKAACVCDSAMSDPAVVSNPADRAETAFERLGTVTGTELDPRVVDALGSVISRSL
jgi:HD-GYP domain-containing protein (c-di-GMP phosphodiesterase class II)